MGRQQENQGPAGRLHLHPQRERHRLGNLPLPVQSSSPLHQVPARNQQQQDVRRKGGFTR